MRPWWEERGEAGVRCSGDARQLHAPDRPDDRRMAGEEPYPRVTRSPGQAGCGRAGGGVAGRGRPRRAGGVPARLRDRGRATTRRRGGPGDAALTGGPPAGGPGRPPGDRARAGGRGPSTPLGLGRRLGRSRVVPGRCRGHRVGGDRRVVRPRPRLRRPRSALGHPLPAPSPDGPPARRARAHGTRDGPRPPPRHPVGRQHRPRRARAGPRTDGHPPRSSGRRAPLRQPRARPDRDRAGSDERPEPAHRRRPTATERWKSSSMRAPKFVACSNRDGPPHGANSAPAAPTARAGGRCWPSPSPSWPWWRR